VKEGIWGVLKLRWHSLFKNYRKRVKNSENQSSVSAMQSTEVLASGD